MLRNKATPVEFLQSKKFEEPWDVELKLESKSRYLLVQITATFENLWCSVFKKSYFADLFSIDILHH